MADQKDNNEEDNSDNLIKTMKSGKYPTIVRNRDGKITKSISKFVGTDEFKKVHRQWVKDCNDAVNYENKSKEEIVKKENSEKSVNTVNGVNEEKTVKPETKKEDKNSESSNVSEQNVENVSSEKDNLKLW